MKRLHISFDLETLGNNPNSPIIQIGAKVFNENYDFCGCFDQTADISTIPKDKFEIDYSTIQWWFGQIADNPKLVTPYQEASLTHNQLVSDFRNWLLEITEVYDPTSVFYWSHATFDPPILQNHFRKYGLPLIPYRQFMDLRTLQFITGVTSKTRIGNHHNAYDDAVFQAEYIKLALSAVR